LRNEVDIVMGQLGCTDLARVSADLLCQDSRLERPGAQLPSH
jgi:hypothetical protein